jgi:hypothetical protein
MQLLQFFKLGKKKESGFSKLYWLFFCLLMRCLTLALML